MGRPKTYDRDDVLERALNLFWERGYEGTHLAELVETTGLNRFSLYKEFGGKEGLFAEAMSRYVGQLGVLSAILRREPLGLENLRAYFLALVEHRFRHGCFVLNILGQKHVVEAGIFEKTRALLREGGRMFQDNLEAARERGELAPDTDPEVLARFLVAHEIGLITYGIVEPRRPARRETLALLDRVLR